jgi:hypothetical protein
LHFKREEEEPQGIILARICFNPHDVWRGFYWKFVWCEKCQRKHLNVWLTLVPCFPIHIIFGWRWARIPTPMLRCVPTSLLRVIVGLILLSRITGSGQALLRRAAKLVVRLSLPLAKVPL